MRILLVEDHPPLAEAVKDALQRAQGGAVEAISPAGGGAEFVLSFRPLTT
jgi:DNA-binding response OmpR family regulator